MPLFRFPCGHSKAYLVTLLVCFRRVGPIHVNFFLAISFVIYLFVVLSCHLVFSMYLTYLLMNVCTIWVVVSVTLHVSEPYSSTLFTLVVKILILLRVEKDDIAI